MFPDADVPVIPLSIQSRGGAAQAYKLGQALAPLAAKGFLVIASGNITHNLRDYQVAARHSGQTPPYVREFTDWLATRLANRDIPALLDYRRQAPGAVQAHPSDEHLLPLYVALGAGGDSAPERTLPCRHRRLRHRHGCLFIFALKGGSTIDDRSATAKALHG